MSLIYVSDRDYWVGVATCTQQAMTSFGTVVADDTMGIKVPKTRDLFEAYLIGMRLGLVV